MRKILIVEDEAIFVLELKLRLEKMGHLIVGQASDLSEAISCAITCNPDLVFMDISISGIDDGIMVAEIITAEFGMPVIFLSGFSDPITKKRAAYVNPAAFLTKPLSERELCDALAGLAAENTSTQKVFQPDDIPARNQNQESELCRKLLESTNETAIHSYRIKFWSLRLADLLDLPDKQRRRLGGAAILHDIGKMLIPKTIIDKPGPLTDDEYIQVKEHSAYAEILLGDLDDSRDFSTIIRHHHERWDGTGYPDHLRGPAIPLESRIIALADAFDVMTHTRSYKKAMSTEDAICEIRRCAGRHFDPILAEQFIRCIS